MHDLPRLQLIRLSATTDVNEGKNIQRSGLHSRARHARTGSSRLNMTQIKFNHLGEAIQPPFLASCTTSLSTKSSRAIHAHHKRHDFLLCRHEKMKDKRTPGSLKVTSVHTMPHFNQRETWGVPNKNDFKQSGCDRLVIAILEAKIFAVNR